MKEKYYHTCPICGANLDPGEVCEDCNPRARIPWMSAKDYKAVKSSIRKEDCKNGNSKKD